jgi:ribosome-associated toxin RatA of RatAB toxin-antitoxin module
MWLPRVYPCRRCSRTSDNAPSISLVVVCRPEIGLGASDFPAYPQKMIEIARRPGNNAELDGCPVRHRRRRRIHRGRYGQPKNNLGTAPLRYIPEMLIEESREVVIEAGPEEILSVLADLESLPEWSPIHKSSEVIETGDDGRPTLARMKVKTAGITDEQVLAYTWSGNTVSWTLVSAKQQRSQDVTYTLTPEGDRTRVKFEIALDPVPPLPKFVLKTATEGVLDTLTEGLRKRVLSVQQHR